ncbi:MAG: YigZ family protein [Lachnospiraceae bacterium]|nr:YigZ family protein [Lachnospiraceae bacterium]
MEFYTVDSRMAPDRNAYLACGAGFAGEGEIVEKKSRFIASVWQVEEEEQVRSLLAVEKKKYPDARHYCYAYVIGKNKDFVRAADDGEPQGTAGKPILEVIDKNNLINTCIIVTRIFGGVLLGTGGLSRAYSDAAKAGLDDSEVVKLIPGKELLISVDYSMSEKIKYFLEKENVRIDNIDYGQDVKITALVSDAKFDGILNRVSELTASKAETEVVSELDIVESI